MDCVVVPSSVKTEAKEESGSDISSKEVFKDPD